MRRVTCVIVGLLACACAGATAAAQQFFYPPAAAARVTVERDVVFAGPSDAPRLMDVYRPAGARSGERRPAFIFFASGQTPQRGQPWPSGWGRAAAANGLVAFVPDIRPADAAADVDAVVAYVVTHARDLGVDPDAVALCAGSGNVNAALPLVESPDRRGIRAAVMLYGTAAVDVFRRDLPVLLVRAGLDRADVNRDIAQVAVDAMTQNAPVTLMNHASGHHAFEMIDDDAATVTAIDAVIAFVKRATRGDYQTASRAAAREVAAAGAFLGGDYAAASTAYEELVRERPQDVRLRLSYGESLLAERRYADACAEFARLRGAALGARDLGVPAARACALHGDADAAIAWLKTIPSRFLPQALEHDAAFESLRGRADFHALFR